MFATPESGDYLLFPLVIDYRHARLLDSALAPPAQPASARVQLFYQLYNVDIVFEDAYGVWREDLDNATPGKQQALIQVNEFLVWLETAAEDEED